MPLEHVLVSSARECSQSSASEIELELKRRRHRFISPPYPLGWFQVARSTALKAGDVIPLEFYGLDLVLFRTQSGQAVLLDGVCPHLGVHLGYGGAVVGETIECPSHAWRFNSEGTCVYVPDGEEGQRDASAECWPVIERNGLVLVWFHPDKQPAAFEIPDIPELGSPDWSDIKTSHWTARTRNQGMAEDAFDEVYSRFLSSLHDLPSSELRQDGEILHITSQAVLETAEGTIASGIQTAAHGFGFATTRLNAQSDAMAISSVIPIDDETVDLSVVYKVRKVDENAASCDAGQTWVKGLDRRLAEAVARWDLEPAADWSSALDQVGQIETYRTWC